MTEQVVITRAARIELAAVVRDQQPHEACGALLGHCRFGEWWEIFEIRALTNQAADPVRTYLIPAADVREVEQYAARSGTAVVGFFHSHPEGNSPSPTDARLAWPGFVYLIADASTAQLRAWTLPYDRQAFVPVTLCDA